jgi:hypothetical protein
VIHGTLVGGNRESLILSPVILNLFQDDEGREGRGESDAVQAPGAPMNRYLGAGS